MVDGQKFLVIRFGTNIVEDCVEKHQDIIEQNGYCWFGKIGVVPSQKVLQSVFEEEKPTLILYTRNKAYICELLETTDKKPIEGYPKYYEDELFETGRVPKIYFKLRSIHKMELSELSKCIICSSGNGLLNTLNKSMSSFFVAEVPNSNSIRREDVTIKKTRPQKNKTNKLDINDCLYRKDGKCNLKGFVNYQYECTRPSNCIKQKR